MQSKTGLSCSDLQLKPLAPQHVLPAPITDVQGKGLEQQNTKKQDNAEQNKARLWEPASDAPSKAKTKQQQGENKAKQSKGPIVTCDTLRAQPDR